MRLKTSISLFALAAVAACTTPETPLGEDPFSREGLSQGLNATVVWQNFEGGFWALRTDDGRLLDPHETLPSDFRVNNLRVHVVSRALDSVVCFHQAGIIVSISSIERR